MLFKLGPLRLKQILCHTATWPKINISSWNETSRNFDRENYLLRILDLNQWHHRSSWTIKINHDVHYQSPLSRLQWNHLWEEKLRPHSYNLTLKIPPDRLWLSGAKLPMPWHPQMWQTQPHPTTQIHIHQILLHELTYIFLGHFTAIRRIHEFRVISAATLVGRGSQSPHCRHHPHFLHH